jgi:hypothetical protein
MASPRVATSPSTSKSRSLESDICPRYTTCRTGTEIAIQSPDSRDASSTSHTHRVGIRAHRSAHRPEHLRVGRQAHEPRRRQLSLHDPAQGRKHAGESSMRKLQGRPLEGRQGRSHPVHACPSVRSPRRHQAITPHGQPLSAPLTSCLARAWLLVRYPSTSMRRMASRPGKMSSTNSSTTTPRFRDRTSAMNDGTGPTQPSITTCGQKALYEPAGWGS